MVSSSNIKSPITCRTQFLCAFLLCLNAYKLNLMTNKLMCGGEWLHVCQWMRTFWLHWQDSQFIFHEFGLFYYFPLLHMQQLRVQPVYTHSMWPVPLQYKLIDCLADWKCHYSCLSSPKIGRTVHIVFVRILKPSQMCLLAYSLTPFCGQSKLPAVLYTSITVPIRPDASSLKCAGIFLLDFIAIGLLYMEPTWMCYVNCWPLPPLYGNVILEDANALTYG